jgi:hypothetical protein
MEENEEELRQAAAFPLDVEAYENDNYTSTTSSNDEDVFFQLQIDPTLMSTSTIDSMTSNTSSEAYRYLLEELDHATPYGHSTRSEQEVEEEEEVQEQEQEEEVQEEEEEEEEYSIGSDEYEEQEPPHVNSTDFSNINSKILLFPPQQSKQQARASPPLNNSDTKTMKMMTDNVFSYADYYDQQNCAKLMHSANKKLLQKIDQQAKLIERFQKDQHVQSIQIQELKNDLFIKKQVSTSSFLFIYFPS